ncbi:MAG: glycosyltransferase family 4 protein [Gammaproteobacteria bacterium]
MFNFNGFEINGSNTAGEAMARQVALYHPWIYLKSGLERTLLELAKRSRHQWTFYTSHYDSENTYPDLKLYNIQEVNRVSVQREYRSVLNAAKTITQTVLPLEGKDLLVVSCDGLGSLITCRNRIPTINLCFTPLRAVYDEIYREHHLLQHAKKRWLALGFESAFRIIDKLLWSRYQKIISISDCVKTRIVSANLASKEKIDVVYPGIDEKNIVASDVFESFFFLPGRIMWTKNIELAITAFRQFKNLTKHNFRLVIAGMVDEKSKPYFEKLKQLAGHSPDVIFCLNPDDATLCDYYHRCYATLFTAFNEDLGLTPMEAMSHGKPVIAVNRGGPREVIVHGETGLLMPADENAFALAMEQLVSHQARARALGHAGLERVKQFTWEKFVSKMDDVVDRVTGETENLSKRSMKDDVLT